MSDLTFEVDRGRVSAHYKGESVALWDSYVNRSTVTTPSGATYAYEGYAMLSLGTWERKVRGAWEESP